MPKFREKIREYPAWGYVWGARTHIGERAFASSFLLMATSLAVAIQAAQAAILQPGGVAVAPTPRIWDVADELAG